MRTIALPLTLAATLGISACCCDMRGPIEELSIASPPGRSLAAVSQDARLSLAAAAAPGMEGAFIYDWDKRARDQRRLAAEYQREIERQAGIAP